MDKMLASGTMIVGTLCAFGACAFGARSTPKDQKVTRFVLWTGAAACIPAVGLLLASDIARLGTEQIEQLRSEAAERTRLLCDGGGTRTDRIVLCMEIDRLRNELAATRKDGTR